MSDYTWNTAVPANSLYISDIPGAIRDAKIQLESRLDKEHEAYASGTLAGCGMEHKEGSARAYRINSEPTARPDGSTALNTDDGGRLWVDSTGDLNILYVYSGDDDQWEGVIPPGADVATAEGDGSTAVGDLFALLPGRTGGQSLLGGTGDDDALNLGGSSHANEGPINIVADDTTLVEFNSVPAYSFVLGEDASGGTTDGSDGAKFTLLKTASATYDALTKGVLSIIAGNGSTTGDISATGHIVQASIGSGTGAGSDLSVDIGYAPDFVIAYIGKLSTNRPIFLWASTHASNNIQISGSGAQMIANDAIQVASTTITLPNAGGANTSSETSYYIALRFNAAVQNLT